MRFADFPVAPFLIGYVLSAQLEYRLGQAVIYKGDMPLTEYLFSAPVALVLFAVSACLLLAPMLRPLGPAGESKNLYPRSVPCSESCCSPSPPYAS